jgi:hypothetical protein
VGWPSFADPRNTQADGHDYNCAYNSGYRGGAESAAIQASKARAVDGIDQHAPEPRDRCKYSYALPHGPLPHGSYLKRLVLAEQAGLRAVRIGQLRR